MDEKKLWKMNWEWKGIKKLGNERLVGIESGNRDDKMVKKWAAQATNIHQKLNVYFLYSSLQF